MTTNDITATYVVNTGYITKKLVRYVNNRLSVTPFENVRIDVIEKSGHNARLNGVNYQTEIIIVLHGQLTDLSVVRDFEDYIESLNWNIVASGRLLC
ncbi:MAG: hypothetical protein ACRCWQ_13695 [Bacilli bacterium]